MIQRKSNLFNKSDHALNKQCAPLLDKTIITVSTWTKLMSYYSVRPERVEGVLMVRQAHHERFIKYSKIILSRYLLFQKKERYDT